MSNFQISWVTLQQVRYVKELTMIELLLSSPNSTVFPKYKEEDNSLQNIVVYD